MLQNYSTYRLLQEFFDYPRKNFQIRELSRRIGLAPVSVINNLKMLVKERLVVIVKDGLYPSYKANKDNKEFMILKKQNITHRIYKTGLVDFIDEKVRPDCIVLFGSASRGEDTEKSDLDFFIQANETELDLKHYEKLLNRKINALFEADIKKISKELLNNIINGEVLYGYLKVF